jgi:NAD(P)H-dependent FMN reductase
MHQRLVPCPTSARGHEKDSTSRYGACRACSHCVRRRLGRAVLKNAIDWVYPEWNRKAAAFVSYGSVMGARAVQQLRETMIELQVAPVRSSVHVPMPVLMTHFQGGDASLGLNELEARAKVMIDDLLWWTEALKSARGLAS